MSGFRMLPIFVGSDFGSCNIVSGNSSFPSYSPLNWVHFSRFQRRNTLSICLWLHLLQRKRSGEQTFCFLFSSETNKTVVWYPAFKQTKYRRDNPNNRHQNAWSIWKTRLGCHIIGLLIFVQKNISTVGIQLSALQLLETSSCRTFISPSTEW